LEIFSALRGILYLEHLAVVSARQDETSRHPLNELHGTPQVFFTKELPFEWPTDALR